MSAIHGMYRRTFTTGDALAQSRSASFRRLGSFDSGAVLEDIETASIEFMLFGSIATMAYIIYLEGPSPSELGQLGGISRRRGEEHEDGRRRPGKAESGGERRSEGELHALHVLVAQER